MTKTCMHSKASLVGKGALIADRTGAGVCGDVRWCPQCGAIRAETFVATGPVVGEWLYVRERAVVAGSQQARAAEEHAKAQAEARNAELERAERIEQGLPPEPLHA